VRSGSDVPSGAGAKLDVVLPLALSGDEWIALAGVLSGALGVLVGVGFAYVNGKSERAHSERVARSGRLHGQRLSAYVELARALRRQGMYVVRTEPLVGPQPDPPAALDDEEWAALMGKAIVAASPDVLAALEDANTETMTFQFAVNELAQMNAQAALPNLLVAARQRLDDTRGRALNAIEETERLMREELATL
jgi:hypothetical protein